MMDIEEEAAAAAEAKPLLALRFTPKFQLLAELMAKTTTKIHSIEFSDVHVAHSEGGSKSPILINCHGYTKPEEMLTILGPSPEVQTKLLHVLAGRRHALRGLKSGKFTVNQGTDALFKTMYYGFVVSKPHHMKTSTVKEEFQFVFDLRYPGEDKTVRAALIDELLSSLGINALAHKQIGALQQWELKRVALGVELLSLPNVLFVNQPLADNLKADWEMIQILQTVHRLGICQIIITLHNANSGIFQLIAGHFLLLNASGETLFVGNGHDALRHVSSIGRPLVDPHISTGDHLLLCAEFACNQVNVSNTACIADAETLRPIPHRRPQRNQIAQFLLLLRRELLFCVRDKRVIVIRFIMTSIIMAVCAVVFMHVGQQTPAYFVGAHYGSFVYPFFVLCFGVMVPTTLILYDVKVLLIRERSTHTYALLPVLFAKLLPEFMVNFAVACEAVLILYFSASWTGEYMKIACALFLLLESCVSYSYFFVFLFDSVVVPLVFVVLTLVPQLLFMSTFIRLAQMAPWLSWIGYVCNVNYALKVVSSVEFDPVQCSNPTICATWNGLLEASFTHRDNMWWYYLVLVLFFVAYRILGFLAIQRLINRFR